MRASLRGLLLALALLPGPLVADILLDGHQHIGNDQGRCEFTPDDPVTRSQIQGFPSHFFLSEITTITAVRLNGATGVDNNLRVAIDGSDVTSSCSGCTSCNLPGAITCGGNNACAGGVVINLTGLAPLPPGLHTIAVYDPASSGNDYSFSSLTLVSPQTSTAVMLNQRRHPGIPGDSTDTDSDDNYDIPGQAGASAPYFYPDLPEGEPLSISFTLGQNRRISDISFYRARGVDNAPPNEARVHIDNQFVGAIAQTGPNPATRSIPTNFLALAGPHTLRVDLGVIGGSNKDSFSWDDIIIRTVDAAPTGTLGSFNAVDVGQTPLNGVISTKIANRTFELDIHAINPLGTGVNPAYQGTVSVELLDASNDAGPRDIYGCRSSWTVLGSLGSVTFGVGNNGTKRLPNAAYPNAARVARVRVTDTSTGARGCSTDGLAVRPREFQVVASHGSESTAGLTENLPTGGYSASSTPRHKAGRPFTLRVTPVGEGGGAVSGYSGQPTVTAQQPVLGTVLGTAASGPWTDSGGVLRSDTVTYSEAGAVRLRVEDTSFADVDVADTPAPDRTVMNDNVLVGRFIPDHFRVALGELEPGCGSFSYVGQPFGYPGGTAVTLTAENAANITTLGYTGTLFRLPASIPQANFSIYDDPVIAGIPALTVPPGSHAVADLGAGVASIQLPSIAVTRPATASLEPFPAEIGIGLPVFTDLDGVAPEVSPIVLGTAAAGTGAPFTGGAAALKSMRYGRLYLESAVGSERAPLVVPLRVEYWDGVGFGNSAGDACTTLQAGNVVLSAPVVGGQTATLAPVVPGPSPWPGPWTVTLSAPNVAGNAVLEMDLSVVGPYPWLLDDNTDGDGLYNNNPRATAVFGLYDRSQDNRIYQREVYR